MKRLLTALLLWPLAAFGTVYYIDLDAGNDGAAGTAIGTAWLTIEKAATTLTAGDIAYVRANTSQTMTGSVAFTNDGTLASPIKIIGCDSVINDPWGDASDVLPLLDFNAGAYALSITGDDYWYLERLRLLNSHYSFGPLYYTSHGLHVEACTFEDNYYYGMYLDGGIIHVQNCTFTNNGDQSTSVGSVNAFGGNVYFYNCTFNPYLTNRMCITAPNTGTAAIFAEKCTFGASTYAIQAAVSSTVSIVRNCSFSSSCNLFGRPGQVSEDDTYNNSSGRILVDGTDIDGSVLEKGHQWQFHYAGEIDSDSTYARSGGGTQGWRFQANADCTSTCPLNLMYFVYVDDTDAHNYSMWCKFQADAFDKGADLDETEIGFYITELKGDGTIAQTAMGATTWDFDNTTTWQQGALTSFTASAAGALRIDVFVASASGDVYIDPPVGEAGAGNEGYADGTVYYNIANVGGGGGSVRLIGGTLAR